MDMALLEQLRQINETLKRIADILGPNHYYVQNGYKTVNVNNNTDKMILDGIRKGKG